MDCDFKQIINKKISNLLKKQKLCDDLLKKSICSIKKVFPSEPDIGDIQNIIETFLYSTEEEHQVSKKLFSLITVSECRRINLKNDVTKGFYWCFGLHTEPSENSVLIGYLYMNKQFAVTLLKDLRYAIACIIVAPDRSTLPSFFDRYVLIKKFKIFTECYDDPNVTNLEYLYFNIADVTILNWEHLEKKCPKVAVNVDNFPFKLELFVVRKSSALVSNKGSPEIWLEVLINEGNIVSQPRLLCLGSQLATSGIILENGNTYILYHQKESMSYVNHEVKRLRPNLVSFKIDDEHAIFQKVNDNALTANKEVVLNVYEAFRNMESSGNDFVCFKGKLQKKKFVDPLSSRTSFSSKHVGFGTPGTKTHVLEFSEENCKVTVYLNNWERLQMPFGLLPEMEVVVRNVIVQKKKYYKSTAFTSFEIISYLPNVIFNTANLYSDPEAESTLTYIGFGDLLPNDIIIWTKICSIKIRSLKIYTSCSACKSHCSCNSEQKVKTSLTCFAKDELAEVFIISDCLEFLRLILDLQPRQWNILMEGLLTVGKFYYDFSSIEETSNVCEFQKSLWQVINYINETKLINLEMEIKCIKLYHTPYDNQGLSLWRCIDARKTSLS